MCLQDVKIGRSLNSRSASASPAANTDTRILAGNAARISLTATLITDGADAAKIVEVFTPGGGGKLAFGSLNRAQPSITVHIDEAGIEMTGEIWVNDNNTAAAATATVRITERFAPKSLEEVVK